MGHKVNPTSYRLSVTSGWQSRWFAGNSTFANFLREDTQIREFLEKRFRRAGVVLVGIDRSGDGSAQVTIHTTRPGMLIGKGGTGLETLLKRLKAELGLRSEIRLSIEEVRDPNLSAQAVANHIAEQIEKRVAFRRLLKQSVEQVMLAGARGVKVAIGGRLNGAEIARTEHLTQGIMPLHTLRANIDFARSTAFTTYGTVGIKVWIARDREENRAPKPWAENGNGNRDRVRRQGNNNYRGNGGGRR